MEKKNVLVLYPCDDATRQKLSQAAADRCNLFFVNPGEDYQAYLKDAHIILGESTNDDLRLCQKLEYLQSPNSGVNYYLDGNTLPDDALFCCATGCYGNIIAEHMLAMTMALCRRLPEYRDQQNRKEWQLLRYDKPLEDATVLILGAGDIGTTLARWLRPMVGKIIGMRRVVRTFPDCYDEMITPAQLDDYLPMADIVLCALPQTPETVGLLNKKRLGSMKADAVLINGGRGSLIDQEALCRLLDGGKFWGVGLEVTTPEPLPKDHPLWKYPKVLITPHAAGNSFAPGSPLDRKIASLMVRNLCAYLTGQPLEGQVDRNTGYRKTT